MEEFGTNSMPLLYNHHKWIPIIVAIVSGAGLVFASGCQSSATTVVNDQNLSSIEATPTIQLGRTPTVQIAPTPTLTNTVEDVPITLTFWTVEEVSSMAEGELGDFFQASIGNFEQTNPDIEVEILIKKASGKGGVTDFLRTAGEVAPSVLPDIAIMDATDLNQAHTDNLIQILDGRLDRSIVQDLLPAARRMGTVDESLVGVPLGLEMEHTVYNTRTFTSTLVLWTDVLSASTGYAFPAKGINGLVNDATLSHYFSVGGELLDGQGLPKIDEQALRDVLSFYQQAHELGIIDASVLEASTVEELWPIYLEAEASLAQISVRQYLTDRDLLTTSAFGPLPIQEPSDIPTSVMHGWVLVLVTDEVNRQEAALSLMEFFLSTDQNADWNEINKSIPIRDTAYQQLAGDDPYWAFLSEQLKTARPEPNFLEYDRVGRIIQQAVEQVIRAEATANEATITALDALTQ